MKAAYINTVFEDYVSSKSTYILLWLCVANDDKTQSTSSQIVKQIEFIQKYFYPGVKLNESALNKELEDQTQFSPTKHYRKRKMNLLLLIYIIARYHTN